MDRQKPIFNDKALTNKAAIAALFGVTTRTVERWHAAGVLPPAIIVGGTLRWHAAEIERLLEAHRERTGDRPAAHAGTVRA